MRPRVGEDGSDYPSDIRRGNWIDRLLPAPARPYGHLMRLDRPIGTWLLLMAGGVPDADIVLVEPERACRADEPVEILEREPVDLAVLAVFYVPCGLGITVGWHRYFSHKSFETSAPLRAGVDTHRRVDFLPDLFGHKGDGVRGPALVAALCAAVATYVAVRFLLRYLETNRLTSFGYYCIGAGDVFSDPIGS